MTILIVTQYFWPESFIINDFVLQLEKLGHKVILATGKPNYPEGKIFRGYKAWGIQSELFGTATKVYRVPIIPRGHSSALRLVLNYLSFVIFGSVIFPFVLRGQRIDHIMVFAPSPIFQAIPAIFIKFIKKAKLSIWVQDLWPEALSATGFVNNRFALFGIEQIVRLIYYFADFLLAQSNAFKARLQQMTSGAKVHYFPNCFTLAKVPSQQSAAILPEDLLRFFNEHFCFSFAGNLGTAQDIENILDAAEIIKLKSTKIGIVLIGSGSLSDWLQQEVVRRNLNNVFLAGRFTMDQMPLLFDLSKCLLVTLKDHPTLNLTIPSKIQAYLAAQRPIIGALNGEGASIITDAKAGFVVSAGRPQELATSILNFSELTVLDREQMARNGYQFFLQNFDTTRTIDRFISIISN